MAEQTTFLAIDPEQLRTIVTDAVTTAFTAHTNQQTPPSDELVTWNESAKYLRISSPTLRRQVTRGAIVPVRIGRRVFFRRSDLEGLIRDGGAA